MVKFICKCGHSKDIGDEKEYFLGKERLKLFCTECKRVYEFTSKLLEGEIVCQECGTKIGETEEGSYYCPICDDITYFS